jgi:predicted CopG family antitoxin
MGVFILIKDDNKRICVTLSKEVYKRLLKQANYEDRSLSNMASQIIKKYYGLNTDDE